MHGHIRSHMCSVTAGLARVRLHGEQGCSRFRRNASNVVLTWGYMPVHARLHCTALHCTALHDAGRTCATPATCHPSSLPRRVGRGGVSLPSPHLPGACVPSLLLPPPPPGGAPARMKPGQLVERWTSGGLAWVEALEQLNPAMRTKMCDISPEILTVRRS